MKKNSNYMIVRTLNTNLYIAIFKNLCIIVNE